MLMLLRASAKYANMPKYACPLSVPCPGMGMCLSLFVVPFRVLSLLKYAMRKITLIVGPTGAGKSDYAVCLALEQSAAIISVDAFQVYRGLDIGTAKLTLSERKGVPHYAIDIVEPAEGFSVADYITYVSRLLAGELRDRHIVFCGGTGFYYNALINGLCLSLSVKDETVRRRLRAQAAEKGREWLWGELKKVDTEAAAKIHANDLFRVVRALEVYELTGQKISAQQKKQPSILGTGTTGIDAHIGYRIIGLTMPRAELYARLDARVDNMFERGLLDEARGLLARGCTAELSSMQAIGYKEALRYLQGLSSREEMLADIKQNTRNFAKRQYTWFRAFKNVEWLEL
ncbi:tRNA (adenosine(37)-N6)-dimethylallyltransferase MiaA [Candidatus Termititenax aidoneus]|uniref:tRNA dimethylallyltransferase n=1 Tax=Termititenax aidoneus TaxID=2218524 RepID=A0A388T9J0_TERA1|nr:tRNA (adenosine(37)-N6)-dimethylallyltransferase MiaA [Candidatus Termititenax aidoneus]